jgi:hypothetical protein
MHNDDSLDSLRMQVAELWARFDELQAARRAQRRAPRREPAGRTDADPDGRPDPR